MKKLLVFATIVSLALLMSPLCLAQGVGHTKLLPYSLDYPMIRAALYQGIGPSLHARNFGVVKVFRNDIIYNFDRALKESYEWNQNWAGYGTLGHGEDVFTARAARFRESHQGR
jgi:hypothetical protein